MDAKGKLLLELRSHELVREVVQESHPHISSFNFSNKAFWDKKWDVTNVKARGLFLNNSTGDVVARSYNKFFGIEERTETQLRNLKRNLRFPLSIYKKENGFLGILGYDDTTDELVFCSKSMINGIFSNMFKDMFLNAISADGLLHLKEVIKEQKVSMVFEVVSPTQDPHIIEYDADQITLLDIVKNDVDFNKLSYGELNRWAEVNFLPYVKSPHGVKEVEAIHETLDEFLEWYRSLNGMNVKHEGFVLEDASGFSFKIKCKFYSYWKHVRGIQRRIKKLKFEGFDIDHIRANLNKNISGQNDPDGRGNLEGLVEWLLRQEYHVLQQSVIDIRKMYFRQL